ncbi:PaREP1 family protein [Saccharolobus islandicus]|uniref:PaREP1 family protein n=2 Tax=Saccharolobus islandicus TaxID=43080 RepID=C4KLH4_SACI6|nr:PaREP1 family protein [Sulfolobus islandicus]ACP56380.1 PaREP1 family protein [Sulfolobus islandicus M.16.27]ACR43055.1 PaREP1 family protein [Sulfolobus islandicus M.16.4]
MYEVLDYKADPRSYVYIKVMETLTEGKLALEMLKKGMITNASSKTFITVKAMVSALVIKNFDKIVQSKSEKEKDWYERVGYSAPTTGLIGISYDLEKLGYDVQLIVKTALLLHSFSYNGFDPNFVNYKDKGEVERDILTVVEFIKRNIKKYFEDIWDEKLEDKLKELSY